MRTWAVFLFVCLGACSATSYGVATDGVFPPRPSGADYPNWEHLCVEVSRGTSTETLNDSGKQGWELVGVVQQSGTDFMCFKRPKAPGRGE